MGYFNYHAKCKNKIKEGKLTNFQVVQNWNGIKPALVLYFNDFPPMPIREHKWEEYFELIKDTANKNK